MSDFLKHIGLDRQAEKVQLTVSDIHSNRNGNVQGGVLATMLDMACGREVASHLDEGQTTATVSLTVTYLRPGRIGSTLTANAETLHRGKNLVMVQGDVFDDEDRRIAHAAATFSVMDRQS
ncbi:PaaI family thioesterase [Ammonicoccus fulvus]|uniref:PaaI family thioesterase n=1 Tax=Ammonicoccus fulvus TaxID=3138240 RepID=A0ABZ3FRI9_9ACTN